MIIPDKVSIKDTRDLYLQNDNCGKRVNKADYLAIVADFMKFIVELIFHGHTIVLPVKCGTLDIKGKEGTLQMKTTLDLNDKSQTRTRLGVDWKTTKELWEKNPKAKEEKKLIFFFNEGTDSIVYKIRWQTFRSNLRHSTLYKFVFTRNNKRDTASLIKHGLEFETYKVKYNV